MKPSWLILWRRSRGELRDEHAFANILSRESLFVLNNLVFVALFIAIFWGSFGAPLSLQAWTNLRNLNSYQPSNSVKSSGMMFGANRVQSHRLTNVRVIFQSGESKNLRIP